MSTDPFDPAKSGRDPVGIIVQHIRRVPRRPRAAAFVWGREECPAPSLPFGRWKTEALSAA